MQESHNSYLMYFDLDNFKAYNDAYGFDNGDKMIKALADSIQYGAKEDFLGHVGGDDFVLITARENPVEIAQNIIEKFKTYLKELYQEKDWERGYIVSKNRKGIMEQFPVASVSIAVVVCHKSAQETMTTLSHKIAKAKKEAKAQEGNSVFFLS